MSADLTRETPEAAIQIEPPMVTPSRLQSTLSQSMGLENSPIAGGQLAHLLKYTTLHFHYIRPNTDDVCTYAFIAEAVTPGDDVIILHLIVPKTLLIRSHSISTFY